MNLKINHVQHIGLLVFANVMAWKNGCKYFNVLGPDGERLEFNQIL